MKRHFLGLVATAAIACGLLGAQTATPPQQGSGPHGRHADPQQRIDMLATLLNLTDAQKTQAATIFTNASQSATPLRDSVKQAHEQLQAAVKANSTNDIDQLSTTIGDAEGKLTAIHAKAFAAFYAILTPDQQSKLNDLSKHRGMFGAAGMGFRPGF